MGWIAGFSYTLRHRNKVRVVPGPVPSCVHSFIDSFIHLFIHSLVCSFIHSLIRSFTHAFIHSFVGLFHRRLLAGGTVPWRLGGKPQSCPLGAHMPVAGQTANTQTHSTSPRSRLRRSEGTRLLGVAPVDKEFGDSPAENRRCEQRSGGEREYLGILWTVWDTCKHSSAPRAASATALRLKKARSV